MFVTQLFLLLPPSASQCLTEHGGTALLLLVDDLQSPLALDREFLFEIHQVDTDCASPTALSRRFPIVICSGRGVTREKHV